MGFRDFIDAVLGRSRLPKAKTDKLFAISTASITLESNLGLKSSGAAGICFKPIDASAYESARKEIQELLEYSSKETKTEFRLEKDEFNFLWAIFKDPDFEDLVANIHLVSETLEEHGFGEQLLCAIYRFDSEPGKQRDSPFEFRLRAEMEREMPVEKNVEKWYPLWGIPF